MLDPETGKLNIEGYASKLPHDIEINTEDTQYFPFGNLLKVRTWNAAMLHTETHGFWIVFADFNVFCSTAITVFDKGNPAGS